MELYNLKDPGEQVSFAGALRRGLGRNQGLFFPRQLPKLENLDELLEMDFITRSAKVLGAWIGGEIAPDELERRVRQAFNFPVPLRPVQEDMAALELFHGPTLAFKDFGARFMAQMVDHFDRGRRTTVLTATSGDTGAAVAQAFWGVKNVQVVVLYPRGKISQLQEKLFCTLGGNVTTLAVEGDFDSCQSLVKEAFDDSSLVESLGLNSANSINVSRLLAQVCYYFEALAQVPPARRRDTVIAVPSGNFGNLTAGLLAWTMGLPVRRFVAATNSNDTVPRYLRSGRWEPRDTVATLSNSMDVSRPNNWPRVEELMRRLGRPLTGLASGSLDDQATQEAMKDLHRLGYLAEPHSAVAWRVLRDHLQPGEQGLFLATAHPAKFAGTVESVLGLKLELPQALAARAALPVLSRSIPPAWPALREILVSLQ